MLINSIMKKEDKQLFGILDKKTKERFKKFHKYYINDSKKFVNKISRDYEKSGKFPVQILKIIKRIKKKDYDSAVCILRGALPYAILFESYGWKVHYILCGRRNERIVKNKSELRFNKSVDKTISQIKGKKILIIENNIFSGNSPYKTILELKKSFKIKKPDLFVDYFVKNNVFQKDKKKMNSIGKIFIASKTNVSNEEAGKLIKEFIERLK